MTNKLYGCVLAVLFCNSFFANITLPALFSNNMVLQRQSEVTFWGWANPNEEISISTTWDTTVYNVKANNQAYWEIKVSTGKEGEGHTLRFKGYNEVVLKNVALGEVWLCSGQSNMEMTANWGIKDGNLEAEKANYSGIRFFNIPKTTALAPQNNVSADWVTCTPETMKNNSAIAYFFAQKLHEDLKGVPIGLIIAAWGGTPAEIWIPKATIDQDVLLTENAQKLKATVYGPHESGRAFNAMIYPIVGYKIAGTLWYQGESNVGISNHYETILTAVINSWRALWKEDFPFYIVQIAPYNYGENNYDGVSIRDAQRKVLHLPQTAMVVTSDIATTDDIHPKDKKSVGMRLAAIALSKIYNKSTVVTSGPLFKNLDINKNKITLYFEYAEGLHFKNKTNTQFEIAGADGVFYTAKATLKNNTIIVVSDKVLQPKKVRFAWGNTQQSELFNGTNLPASSFLSE